MSPRHAPALVGFALAGWQLAGLSLAMLLPSLGTSIANTALPTLAESFGASFQDMQWVVLAYLLAMTTLVVSAGRLGDRVGRRRLLLIGIATFTAASALCAVASDLWVLVAARAAQGVGAAIMMALATAIAGDVVPRHRIGSAMGLLGTMSAVGTAMGPSLGGILIAVVGWRGIFAILVPLGAAATVICAMVLRAQPGVPGERKPFDLTGALLLACALSAYAMGVTLGRGTFGTVNLALLLAAAAAFALFALSQAKGGSPLIQPGALKDPALRAGLIATALVSTVMMTTLVVGPFFLSRSLSLPPLQVGLILSVGPVLAALTGLPGGLLVDRFGSRPVALGGLTGVASGSLALAWLAPSMGVWGYTVAIGTMTTGYALFQAANTAAIMGGVIASRRGVVSGLLGLARNLGLITGASVMGAIFAAVSGGIDSPAPAIADATGVTFLVAALLSALAIAATLDRAKLPIAEG